MQIKRCGSQPSAKGPADYFTGNVRIDRLFDTDDPQRVSGKCHVRAGGPHRLAHASARPDIDRDGWLRLGAVLGGPVEELRPGDVISCPPREKHWHGATSTIAMTHLAIQEKLGGKVVEWMEKVTDEQYRR